MLPMGDTSKFVASCTQMLFFAPLENVFLPFGLAILEAKNGAGSNFFGAGRNSSLVIVFIHSV